MSASHSVGIEGKWLSLNEKLEELTAERDDLKGEMESLLPEVKHLRRRIEDFQSTPLSKALDERDQLKALIEELRDKPGTEVIRFKADEQEAMDGLMAAFNIISQRWKLRANGAELTSAVHTIQGFIIQHMLHRVDPDRWGNWWHKQEGNG